MGTSINSLKPRWRRCPDISGRAQNAGPGSGRLRVNSAVHGCTNAAGAGCAGAAAFSRTFIDYGTLPSRLDRIYRGYP